MVIAFGNVPNCGASAGRSTGLLISDGTDSVLRIFVTETEQSRNVRRTQKAFFKDSVSDVLRAENEQSTYWGGMIFDRKEPLSCIYCDTLTCGDENSH